MLYGRVAEALGGHDQLQGWFRYFLVPGMQHVTGTANDSPWYFAQSSSQAILGTDIFSTPGFPDPEHDALMALMRWVEEGVAVDHIIATTWHNSTDPASGVLRQRPLCPFPKKAIYNGKGDVNDAGSWSCSG